MFLRSLTLKGFKSFAEATTIELEPGVTAVVGPNGSGKSNVVDAVAWVLGAQGPRSMRSTRMDDVIFAGNSRRQPLGRAQVSLTIDNSAGLLPIEFSEVTLTRTLFRSSGESEYSINGAPCRLLDVQELLSDTGVGRQQHVIVSQGQLDAVLDAGPTDRRLIIEEAAGILKHRRRKEKAERRLAATEANLVRLTDLSREVGRQLRPLERQAEAAQRHGSMVAEARQLRLHLAGREILILTSRHEAAALTGAECHAAEACQQAELGGLDQDVLIAEASLMAIGQGRLGQTSARLEALRERARGLAAVLAERMRSTEHDRSAQQIAADAAHLIAIDAEVDYLRSAEADMVGADVALGQRSEALVADEMVVANEALWLEGVPALEVADQTVAGALFQIQAAGVGDRSARVRGELGALRTSVTRAQADMDGITSRIAALELRQLTLAETQTTTADLLAAAAVDEAGLQSDLAIARSLSDEADARSLAAQSAEADAVAGSRATRARVDGLALALDRARPTESYELSPGTLGTLASLMMVEPGWEAAVEAVIAEADSILVAESIAMARTLLSASGAPTVVALGVVAPTPPPTQVGSGGHALRDHVRAARPDLEDLLSPLLDVLLAGAIAVEGDWVAGLDMFLADPNRAVVTRAGDRFSATGWRVGGRGWQAARFALEEASERATVADVDLAAARSRMAEARAAQLQAQRHRLEVDAQWRAANARVGSAAEAVSKIEEQTRALAAEMAGLSDQRDQVAARLEPERQQIAHLEAVLPALEAEEADVAQRAEARLAAVRAHREQLDAVRQRRVALDSEKAASVERRQSLARQIEVALERRARVLATAHVATQRIGELDQVVRWVARLRDLVTEHMAEIDSTLAVLQARRRAVEASRRVASEHLESLRRCRHEGEAKLVGARERLRRAELDEAECRIRLDTARESLRADLDCEPSVAVAVECPPLPDGASPVAHMRELERELRLLGPINPLATEELAELQERHAFLTGQLDDVRGSRRELSKVIRAVEASMLEVLQAAYADVAEHFDKLFETLFPGGQGRLHLTDPGNLLETGIEIEARPAGKNVRRLSLLSGGERSLCAMAFLFAVFRSRPSPFYLLDEVEAALDDVNLDRFLALLAEFRQEAQLLVVTHQKRTMEAADCLHGVTMAPGGSSKVVSERLARGGRLEADPVHLVLQDSARGILP